MRIVSFVPYAIWSPHLETDLEIIQNHLDAGDEVEAVVCNVSLSICDPNPAHEFAICLSCVTKRMAGFRLLSRRVKQLNLWSITAVDSEKLNALRTEFGSLDELKTYEFYGFDIGYAALSSLVSMLKEPVPDLSSEEVRKKLSSILLMSAKVFLTFSEFLSVSGCDRVYVFNTRLAVTRAVMRACAARKVECITHDVGGTVDKYELYKNTLPHDRARFVQEVGVAWNSADPLKRTEIGDRFFSERRFPSDPNVLAFTTRQKDGLLPNNWNSSRKNIGIFITSEDEYAAVGSEWEAGVYESQVEGIKRILRDFLDRPEYFFYVRVHPNLRRVNNTQTRSLKALHGSNVEVIPADSPVSTYALMESSEKIVVFGSTVGIEATYWGKPSIHCGVAFYSSLGAAYEPATHQEVIELLKSDLDPKPREAAVMYGYYMKIFGVDYHHYRSSGPYTGRFKDTEVLPHILVRLWINGIRWLRRIGSPVKRRLLSSFQFAAKT